MRKVVEEGWKFKPRSFSEMEGGLLRLERKIQSKKAQIERSWDQISALARFFLLFNVTFELKV